MIGKYRGGAVPAPPAGRDVGPAWGKGSPLAVEANETADKAREQLEDMDLSGALETIWVFVRRLNRYVEEQAPGSWPRRRTPKAAPESTRPRPSTAPSGTWLKVCACCPRFYIRSSRRPLPPSGSGLGLEPVQGAGPIAEAGAEPRLPDPSWEEARGVCSPRGPAWWPARRSSLASRTDEAARDGRRPSRPVRSLRRTARMFIDSHTHLDHCKDDPAVLVADAAAAGVESDHPVGHRPGALAAVGGHGRADSPRCSPPSASIPRRPGC